MARYFFEVVNGHRLADPAGVDCADDEAAAEQARAVAAQIAEDIPCDRLKRHVTVLDETGRKVASVTVGEQPAASKRSR